MTGNTVKKVEIRKNWVAPELKKIDIGQITASSTVGSHTEGNSSTMHYS
ncbi:MAG: hypothetical protein WAL45_10625 [Terracidiphilus sp.]